MNQFLLVRLIKTKDRIVLFVTLSFKPGQSNSRNRIAPLWCPSNTVAIDAYCICIGGQRKPFTDQASKSLIVFFETQYQVLFEYKTFFFA